MSSNKPLKSAEALSPRRTQEALMSQSIYIHCVSQQMTLMLHTGFTKGIGTISCPANLAGKISKLLTAPSFVTMAF